MPSAAASSPLSCLRCQRPGGFTLLETVVAMALFAAAGMALYALFNSNLIALGRVQDVSRQLPVVRHAMERLSAVNPRQEDEGRFEFDGFDVVWSARLLEPVRHSQGATGFRGAFEVGLYEVEFSIGKGARRVGSWTMRLIGHRRLWEPGFE